MSLAWDSYKCVGLVLIPWQCAAGVCSEALFHPLALLYPCSFRLSVCSARDSSNRGVSPAMDAITEVHDRPDSVVLTVPPTADKP